MRKQYIPNLLRTALENIDNAREIVRKETGDENLLYELAKIADSLEQVTKRLEN